MSNNLLEQLLIAQTLEDETRLLLANLPPNLSETAWAMAIPHWFTADVIAALLPHLAAQASELYIQLQSLAYVEPYQGRGYNIHEKTRDAILALWWDARCDEYRQLSERAEAYFAAQEDDNAQVEAACHLLVTPTFDSTLIASRWSEIASRLKLSGQFSLAHTLIQNAREHIIAGRIPEPIAQLVYEWERAFAGELEALAEERRKKLNLSAEVEIFDLVRRLYSDLGDELALANTLVKLGKTHRRQGELEEAREQIERALTVYLTQGNSAKAAEAYASLGDISWTDDDFEAALTQYNQGLALYPLSAECLAGRGEVYCLQKKFPEAFADLNHAVELKPSEGIFRMARSFAYFCTGQYDEALTDIDYAIRLDPEDLSYIAFRGLVYLQAGQSSAALADFNRAVEVAEDQAWIVLLFRGIAYSWVAQYEAALDDFDHVIEKQPNKAPIFSARGYIHLALKHYDNALADIDHAINLEPDNPIWLSGRAAVFSLQGNLPDLVATMVSIEKQFPDYVKKIQGTLAKAPPDMVHHQFQQWASIIKQNPQALKTIVEAESQSVTQAMLEEIEKLDPSKYFSMEELLDIQSMNQDEAYTIGRSLYDGGDSENAANLLLHSFKMGYTMAGNNLAYMIRRSEVLSNPDWPPIAELLADLIANRDIYGLTNYALCLAAGIQCKQNWRAADNVIASLAQAATPAFVLLDWWYEELVTKKDDPEGHLVIGWLVRHRLAQDPDGMSVAERMARARAGGWNVPEWMDTIAPPQDTTAEGWLAQNPDQPSVQPDCRE